MHVLFFSVSDWLVLLHWIVWLHTRQDDEVDSGLVSHRQNRVGHAVLQ